MREPLKLYVTENCGFDPVVVVDLSSSCDPQEHGVSVHGHHLACHLILYVDIWCPNPLSKPVLSFQYKVSVGHKVGIPQSGVQPPGIIFWNHSVF